MGIFSQVRGPVLRILNELLDDESLSEALNYYLYVGQAFDSELGHNVDRFEIYDVVGARLRNDLTKTPIDYSDIQTGDLFFLFRFADLPATISKKDKIVDAFDVEYKFRTINKVFGLAISISVEGSL